MRGHLERSGVVSFYGASNTSCFQTRGRGHHRLLRDAIHHLQLHMMTRGTTSTTTRVHLGLRRMSRLVSRLLNRLLSRLLNRLISRLRRFRPLRLRAKSASVVPKGDCRPLPKVQKVPPPRTYDKTIEENETAVRPKWNNFLHEKSHRRR